MSGEFEELFQRMADAATAPPQIAFMIRRGMFSTLEYAKACGISKRGANGSLNQYFRRGWLRRVKQGSGKGNPTIWEWMGNI